MIIERYLMRWSWGLNIDNMMIHMRWESRLKCLFDYLTMNVNCLDLNVLCTWAFSFSSHLCELACLHWFWDKGVGSYAPWRILWHKWTGPHAPWWNMNKWGNGPLAPWQVTWTDMHHFITLHCIWVLICRVIVIWTLLWDDDNCGIRDMLVVFPWSYIE